MYAKPLGYNTLMFAAASAVYRPNNDYPSGNMNYAPGAPSAETITLTFNSAPDDLSEIDVYDGPPNAPGTPIKTFVFTWAGAPGTGVIPLVAGGGTAAQAALAAQLVLDDQLDNWTVTNVSAGVIIMTNNNRGFSYPTVVFTGDTEITPLLSGPDFGATLPGRFGKNYCFLPDTVPVEES